MKLINNLNADANARDMILFGKPYEVDNYHGGIRYFNNLSLENLEKMVGLQMISPSESQQSDSPTTEDFLNFAKGHGHVTFHGYAVSPDRNDYRVTIEGVEVAPDDPANSDISFVRAFFEAFRWADEFHMVPLYCWYD